MAQNEKIKDKKGVENAYGVLKWNNDVHTPETTASLAGKRPSKGLTETYSKREKKNEEKEVGKEY